MGIQRGVGPRPSALAALLLHGCLCSLGALAPGDDALPSAVLDGLPRTVVEALPDTARDDARRQAQMAVGWGLFNHRRKESGELESESGPGSSTSFTQGTREYLHDVIERYSVRSIVDVACGDWNWMRHVDLAALGVESYIGYWTTLPATLCSAGANRLGRARCRLRSRVLQRHALQRLTSDLTWCAHGRSPQKQARHQRLRHRRKPAPLQQRHRFLPTRQVSTMSAGASQAFKMPYPVYRHRGCGPNVRSRSK